MLFRSLDPWVIRREQAIYQSLLLPSEKSRLFAKFNVDGLLRGDYASRMSGYSTARQNGWMHANDIRELENMNRIPAEEGGDLYLVNGNMTVMGPPESRKALRGEEEQRNERAFTLAWKRAIWRL